MIIRNSLLLLSSILLVSCNKQSSKLHGTWDVDRDRTLESIKSKYTLTDEEFNSFSSFIGHTAFIYNEDGTASFIESTPGHATKGTLFKYRVLGESKSQTVIQDIYNTGYTEKYPYKILRFEDNDHFSIIFRDDVTGIVGEEFYTRRN